MLKNNKRKFPTSGFTLIEMMVSVSIFVIVAFIVVSTLLTMSYAYKKAQKMRILMDNLGFSLQSMSLNIREGVNYDSYCFSTNNCYISFKSIDSWLANPTGGYTCYSLESQSIRKCVVEYSSSCPCSSSGSLLTSPEIRVTNLHFNVDPAGGLRKKVKIMVSGTAGTNAREETSFFIQNTISQRNLDAIE